LAWTISYTETALKQLTKLDRQAARRLVDFMDERVAPHADPRSQGKVLSGPAFANLWRYRVGDYRIVCEIQDAVVVVLVVNVGHRREVYR
jgi:mRNA interferase RelE/StbE